LRHLAGALAPGGLLLLTDAFNERPDAAEHNRMRPLSRYRSVLNAEGLQLGMTYPTHVLLNRRLGFFRFLNRLPGLLLVVDRTLLAAGLGNLRGSNQLLVARRVR
jgi:hypothetical protein